MRTCCEAVSISTRSVMGSLSGDEVSAGMTTTGLICSDSAEARRKLGGFCGRQKNRTDEKSSITETQQAKHPPLPSSPGSSNGVTASLRGSSVAGVAFRTQILAIKGILYIFNST